MGAVFSSSSGKRRHAVQAESSEASHITDTNTNAPAAPAAGVPQPPLKRRRIEPHNDPITPLYIPPSLTTKSVPDSEIERDLAAQRAAQKTTVLANKAHNGGGPARPRKFAMFFGYNGRNYHGMQINPGVVTIEQVVLEVLQKTGLISAEMKQHPSSISLLRAARTDKGVSAAVQCVSLRLDMNEHMQRYYTELSGPAEDMAQGETDEDAEQAEREQNEIIKAINKELPEDIFMYGLKRTTVAFNARKDCDRRRYEYILPLQLLGGGNKPLNDVREPAGDGQFITDSRIAQMTKLLKQYEGTHCFANFTQGIAAGDDRAKRHMVRVRCMPEPIRLLAEGVYFVVVEVLGQSFLLHQIRKMVGLAMMVHRGVVPPETVSLMLCKDFKGHVPTAPSDGLLLDTLYFDLFNRQNEQRLGHSIDLHSFSALKARFKRNTIYWRIAERENQTHHMRDAFDTCAAKVRSTFAGVDLRALHVKFVLTDQGRREQREAYARSLYTIKLSRPDFLSLREGKDAVPSGSADEANHLNRLYDGVVTAFEKRYGRSPTFMVRAPATVVLAGQHLDVSGLPVIAAAVSRSVMVAGVLENRSELVDVAHIDDDAYASAQKDIDVTDDNLRPDGKRDTQWLGHVFRAMRALAEHLRFKRTVHGGGSLMFASDIPVQQGLASSSALSVAAALSASRLSRKRLPTLEVADVAHKAELKAPATNIKNACVAHAAAIQACKDGLMYARFSPKLAVQQMHTSAEAAQCTFVLVSAQRFDEEWKQRQQQQQHDTNDQQDVILADARNHFNWRVAECKFAAILAAKRLDVHSYKVVNTVGQLWMYAQRTYAIQNRLRAKRAAQVATDTQASQSGLESQASGEENKHVINIDANDDGEEGEEQEQQIPLSLDELRDMVYGVLGTDETISVEQARIELGLNEKEVTNRFLMLGEQFDYEDCASRTLRVGRRVRYVMSEAARVEQFRTLLDTPASASAQALGKLLDDSHHSLRDDFNSFHFRSPTFMLAVAFCKVAGAAGARMHGNFVLCAVDSERMSEFIAACEKRVGEQGVIVVKPWDGACVYAIHDKPASVKNKQQVVTDGANKESETQTKADTVNT